MYICVCVCVCVYCTYCVKTNRQIIKVYICEWNLQTARGTPIGTGLRSIRCSFLIGCRYISTCNRSGVFETHGIRGYLMCLWVSTFGRSQAVIICAWWQRGIWAKSKNASFLGFFLYLLTKSSCHSMVCVQFRATETSFFLILKRYLTMLSVTEIPYFPPPKTHIPPPPLRKSSQKSRSPLTSAKLLC